MTALEILKKARKLITPRAQWTQGFFQRRHKGKPTCFCAVGAVGHVGKKAPPSAKQRAINLLAEVVRINHGSGMGLFTFNDTRTHADVLQLFDYAIERAGVSK